MQCQKCGKEFVKECNLRRHQQEYCQRVIKCDDCGKQFTRTDDLQRHQRNRCEPPIPKKRLRPMGVEVLDSGVTKLYHAFKCRIASYRFSGNNKFSYTDFFDEIKPKVLKKVGDYLQLHGSLKVNCEMFGIYVKPDKEMSDIKSMNTTNKIVTASTNLEPMYEEFKDEITNQASEFQEKDSNWALQEILFLDVNMNRFNSISASSYIKVPAPVARRGGILNIKNNDNACFAWCVNAAIFPAEGDTTKPDSYPHYATLLQFGDIQFPIKLKDIYKFESMNNISVNVYGLNVEYKDGKNCYEVVGPLHFTSNKQETHVNLLLISDDNGNNHYVLITDLSRLVSHQKSKGNRQLLFCDGCLQSFNAVDKLQRHQEHDCTYIYTDLPTTDLKQNKCGETLPQNVYKFVNFEKQLPVPFVIYADFESILKPIQQTEPYDGKSFTTKVCEHQPYSFALYVKCNYDDSLSKLEIYEGLDAPKVFIEKLDTIVHQLYDNHLKHVKPMTSLSSEEWRRYNNAVTCHICDKPFNQENGKVRDHCHLTGNFRNAAHNACNLNYQLPNFVPVFLHNLTNYDCHMFIKDLTSTGERISALAQTKEKYISFSKSILVEKSNDPKVRDTYIRLKFVDSFRFLARSLDALSETLDSKQCNEVRKYFPRDEEFKIMRRKGVFPYSYVDSYEKLKEQKLPSKRNFYDKLRGEDIADDDYQRAETVWKTFNCKTLSDYSLLYLKTDVLLLADVFENFRKVCLEKYKLDPCHYLTAPALSWDAMLRSTDIELQLLTEVDMLHFFKKGIRGGVAQCSKRKVVANNKFLPNYDNQKPESYIMYLDATNLYGAAMSDYLPSGGFRWLSTNEIENLEIEAIPDNAINGYILEVDLEYPTNLHDAHNDLPFCPENMIPPKSKYSKLIPNLNDKEKYIIHYRSLKQCLKYGLHIKKIHRVIEFTQSPWLKKYIELNTKLRNQAKNEFEKDLFKLLINAVFGKTMENVEKRKNIILCSRWENSRGSLGARTLIAKPEYKSSAVFNENLVAVHLNKVKVYYDKPLYVGFAILEISKTIIYDFYYGYVKEKYGDSAKLCYTDTDSLILEVHTDNFYKDITENISYFDTSNYAENNVYRIPKRPSSIGKMKDEFAGVPITSFYGTGAKAYCVELNRPFKNIVKKAKGVSQYVIKNQLHLNDYVQIVEKGGTIFRKMYVFISDMHTVYTELKNKIALSSKDDKRYVIPHDGINTLAWGHLLISPDKHTGTLDNIIKAGLELVNISDNRDESSKISSDSLLATIDLDTTFRNVDISKYLCDLDLRDLDFSDIYV